MKIRRGFLTGAGLLLLLGLRLAAQGVDLAAMRKAEEERRKKITRSGVVLDDKSVKNVPTKDNRFSFIIVESSGAAAPLPDGSPPPPPAATGETTDGKPSAQEWKARKQALEQRVADLRQQIASSQSQLNRMQSDFLMSGLAVEQNRLRVLIEELRAAMATQQNDLKAAEQELANFANEARRAGVPPGWLR